MKTTATAALLLLALVPLTTGCGGDAGAAAGVDIASHRARLMLDAEPAGALPVLDARDECQGEVEMVVLGRIGGSATPWSENRASFLLADPSAEIIDSSGHEGCTDPDCKFCQKRRDDLSQVAVVQIVDEAGRVLPVDARKLLPLEKDQMLVVRGRAKRNELGSLVISANGIYVRR